MSAEIKIFDSGENVVSTQKNFDAQNVYIAGLRTETDRRGDFRFIPCDVYFGALQKNFYNHYVNKPLTLKHGFTVTFENDITDRTSEENFKELKETGVILCIGSAHMTGANSFRLESINSCIKSAGDLEGISKFLKLAESVKAELWGNNIKKYNGIKEMLNRQKQIERNRRKGRAEI